MGEEKVGWVGEEKAGWVGEEKAGWVGEEKAGGWVKKNKKQISYQKYFLTVLTRHNKNIQNVYILQKCHSSVLLQPEFV